MQLGSADGTKVAAYFARAANPSGSGMVVLPDAGGLSEFYKNLAERLAEAGLDAVTIDYYSRTAGSGARPAGFSGDDHMARTQPRTVDDDVAAGAKYLRAAEGGGVRRVFCVGFCFGGAVAWRQAANGLDGAIGFYGSGAALRDTVPDLASLTAPLLLLVAGADKYYLLSDSQETDRALTGAGVPHETVVYDGVPHGFFSDAMNRQICDDAWGRLLRFVKVNSKT